MDVKELIALVRKLLSVVIGGQSELSAQLETMTDDEIIALARADNLEAQIIEERLKAKLNGEQ
jgi:hypothetical protein